MALETYIIKTDAPIDDALFSRLLMLVGKEKREAISRRKVRRDAINMLAGELALILLLKRRYNLDLRGVDFAKNEYGKPYLPGRDDIHFSQSHSGERVLLAISSTEVGADIERIRKCTRPEKIFSAAEALAIEKSENRDVAFTALWTRKEAYAKRLGTGITREILKQDLSDERIETFSFEDYICTTTT